MITFLLSLPPGVNQLYANIAGKGRVKTKAYRDWIHIASTEVMIQRRGNVHFDGDVRVDILVERRGDLDGKLKALLDLLTRMNIVNDDKQVAALTVNFAPISGVQISIEAVIP